VSRKSIEPSVFVQRSALIAVMAITIAGCVLAPSSTSEQAMHEPWARFIAFLLCWLLLGLNLIRLNVQNWIDREKPK
jgi:hypothetical protein